MSTPVISSEEYSQVRIRGITIGFSRTGDCVLDLNAGVDLDEVMATHLVDEEFSCASVTVTHTLSELDGVAKNGLASLFGEMQGRRYFDNLLVPALDGAVALEEMDSVALSIGEDLDFDVTRTLEEALDEDGAIAKRRLGLGDSTLKCVLKLRLLANDTHSTAASAHSSLDNDFAVRQQSQCA